MNKLGKYFTKTENRYKIVLIILSVVILILQIFKIQFGMDFIVITLCIFALIKREAVTFVKDWTVPIILFYLYEGLRSRAYDISQHFGISPIVEPLIWLERKVFFFLDDVPSVKLQYWLRPDLNQIHWYDYVLFFFYVMFFWYWLAAGFLIWLKDRKVFKQYMYGLVAFSIFDVGLYALFPSAPPWWASDRGYFPWISRILWTSDYLPGMGLSVVSTYGRNDFAAFPSHHAAWPFFATLFLVKVFGKKALPLFIVPFMIAFATWYGAEHYVIDSIAAVIVCLITFYIATHWTQIWTPIIKKTSTQTKKK